MTIVNMKKVGNAYEPDSIDLNPFSEFEYMDDRQHEVQCEQPIVQVKQVLNPQDQLMKNIDDVFDGVDMVFNMADRVMDRMRRL